MRYVIADIILINVLIVSKYGNFVTKNRATKNDITKIVGASELMIDGEPFDRRSITARRWCSSFADLAMQIGGGVTLSEAMMLRRAANLAMMCERDEARVMRGDEDDVVDEEHYRRNASASKAALMGPGMASTARISTVRLFPPRLAGGIRPHSA
ncbi:hypothetical protein [Methylobacterium sp. 88A]|uniref:hypothetical protein n=1 Tax=Methylobacterium sp. 88A TaxID=1131813 RepID=UPI0012F693B4|nr:hypothetical protein [Methylobacterium sp. 88A]